MTRRKTLHVRLWHSPYNGGWVWFDLAQWRRFDFHWPTRKPLGGWKGGRDVKLWWCIFGFCGSITLQSYPWERNPGSPEVPRG